MPPVIEKSRRMATTLSKSGRCSATVMGDPHLLGVEVVGKYYKYVFFAMEMANLSCKFDSDRVIPGGIGGLFVYHVVRIALRRNTVDATCKNNAF
ncbi:hypothetical protein E3N88_35607 [Mikania micrantha]|uniref:Uncharacterized protein n=1 Tax=Mikania micrantha TaxID=192012 RepID=A0A5N6M1I1_9ASTR|nr:hypothetical protein E3N88_35607 [Mikania micrantha]